MSEKTIREVMISPDRVGQAEYTAIYEVAEPFMDDPEMVVGILDEFRGWAHHLLRRLEDTSAALVERRKVEKIIREEYEGYRKANGVTDSLSLTGVAAILRELVVARLVYDGTPEERRALWVAIHLIEMIQKQIGDCRWPG